MGPQLEIVEEAANKAAEAISNLYEMYNNGKIANTQFSNAFTKFIQYGETGDESSQ